MPACRLAAASLIGALLCPAVAGQQELYVCTAAGDIYRIDDYAGTPQEVFLGQAQVTPYDIAVEPQSGDFFVSSNVGVVRLDHVTLAETPVGSFPVIVNSLDWMPTGLLVGRGGSAGDLYLMDPKDGAVTLVGPTGFTSAGDLAVEGDGWLLGAAYDAAKSPIVDSIDPQTAAAVSLGVVSLQGNPFGIEVDVDGKLYVYTSENYAYHLDRDDLSVLATWKLDVPVQIWGAAFRLPAGQAEELGTSYCGPAALNSQGLSGLCTAFGSDVVAFDLFELRASALPPGRPGYFLTSQTQAFVPFVGGGQGHLCLGGSIGRFNASVLVAGPGGDFALEVDLDALPQPDGTVAAQPGETWNFQAWYRDVNPLPTSNLTDGRAVTFR